jgi:hypothetical protein
MCFFVLLVDCTIATLSQFHVFVKVSCGSPEVVVGEYSGLHVKLFKFCTT